MAAIAPTRFDVVGSFLRPEALKQARASHAAGELDDAGLIAVEDACIAELVARQKAAGLPLLTDGEFRRSYWHLDFMWGHGGIEHVELDHGYFFVGEETTHGSAVLTGKISGEDHPFVEHFKFVQALEEPGHTAKQTIPAPAQLLLELYRDEAAAERTRSFYPNEDELLEDIGAAYRTVIADLYAAGCRNLQLDDCTWGALVDEGFQAGIRAAGSRRSRSRGTRPSRPSPLPPSSCSSSTATRRRPSAPAASTRTRTSFSKTSARRTAP